jgi:hypothetical protein
VKELILLILYVLLAALYVSLGWRNGGLDVLTAAIWGGCVGLQVAHCINEWDARANSRALRREQMK